MSYHPKKVTYPISAQHIQQHRNKLIKLQEAKRVQSSTPSQQQSLTYGNTTSRTHLNSGSGFSHRIKSCINFHKKPVKRNIVVQNQDSKSKGTGTEGLTTLKPSIHDLYPLQILKSMEKKKQQHIVELNSKNLTKPFLIKGRGVKNAILLSIIKSKINKSIVASGEDYAGCKANQEIANLLANEIPQGMRDTIGLEEILRMTNIYKGANLKAEDLYKKVNNFINTRRECQLRTNNNQQDDNQTLKSIKRW